MKMNDILTVERKKKLAREKRNRILLIRAKQTNAFYHRELITVWYKSPWKANN